MKIRSIFDASEDKGIDCSKTPSKTKQADKDSCDINLILSRYQRTGMLPDMIRKDARYGDFSAVGTYQESLEVVRHAQEQFEALDAKVRDRFANDPVRMLAFCSDPKNMDEMVKLGLAIARKDVPPAQAAAAQSGANSSSSQGSGSQGGVTA